MKLFNIKGKINKFSTNVKEHGLIGASKVYRDNVLLQRKQREVNLNRQLEKNEARRDQLERINHDMKLENLRRDNKLATKANKVTKDQISLARKNAVSETGNHIANTKVKNERKYGQSQDRASKLQNALEVITNRETTTAEIKQLVNDKNLLNTIAGLTPKEMSKLSSGLRKPEKELMKLLHRYSKGDVISIRQFVNKGKRIRVLNLERAGEIIGSAIVAAAAAGASAAVSEDDDANS